MELKAVIQGVEIFEGLTTTELDDIVAICQQKSFKKGDILTVEGDIGEDLFIVENGAVEVLIKRNKKTPKIVIHLGVGQLIGEMSLVDRGLRSATVRAIQEPTTVQVIRHQDFHYLCNRNHRIGYIVMHNIAADLSFKLRHRHLSET